MKVYTFVILSHGHNVYGLCITPVKETITIYSFLVSDIKVINTLQEIRAVTHADELCS